MEALGELPPRSVVRVMRAMMRAALPALALLAATGGALSYAALAGFALPTVRTVLMIAAVLAAMGLAAWAGRPRGTTA